MLICDEIVSALDAHVKIQVLQLLKRLRQDRQLSLIFIGHDLEGVRFIADELLIMHQGRVVEHGPAGQVLTAPQHPHSQRLIAAIPDFLAA